jgi:hypothetical protein
VLHAVVSRQETQEAVRACKRMLWEQRGKTWRWVLSLVMSIPPRRETRRNHRKSKATFLEEDVAPFDLRPLTLAAS